MAACNVCFRKCDIPEGKTGWCRARGTRQGEVVPLNYGVLTGLALDPIEKKPLRKFYPGSRILSAGSYGCNLDCPYCQNFEIASGFADPDTDVLDPDILYRDADGLHRLSVRRMSPAQLNSLALQLRADGNIGVAFTYNEPLISFEYVLDCAKLVRNSGMKNVLVTNGCVSPETASKVIPWIDAANVDLKCFTEAGYKSFLGGSLEHTKQFIELASGKVHLEVTTLIVPGFNDTEEEIEREARWIAGLNGGRGEEIPLHISRFFPRHRMADGEATPVDYIYRLAETAGKYLRYVYTGNI